MECGNFLKKNTKLEKRLILSVVVLCGVALILLIILLCRNDQQICDSPECVQAATHILDTVDPTVNPCEDFYKFACGTFLKNAVSLGQPTTLHHLRTLMKNKLKEIVTEKEDTNVSRALQMQRSFYRACINDTNIDADNDRMLLNLLDEVIGGWPVLKEGNWSAKDFKWLDVMIKARQLGLFYQFFFRVSIFSGNDSINTIWIRPPDVKDIESFQWKQENRNLMAQIASDLGATSRDTSLEIGYTLNFAEELHIIVQEYYDNSKNNEQYNRRHSTIKELKHNQINIHWLEFLKNLTGVAITEEDVVVFDVDRYFDRLSSLLTKPYKIQANYMAWVIISTNIQYMSKNIRQKYMKMRKINETESSRTDLCYKISRELFKNVAEGEYVRRYTPPSKRKYIGEMIKNIRTELQLVLQDTSWIDEETRSYAMNLLQNITGEIGGTKLVYDANKFESLFGYYQVNMTSDKLVDMARLMNINEVNRYYRQLKQTTIEQENELANTPILDVNAFYLKHFKKLVLPTPILQGIVIDERRPHYMNLGSLGSIIGHEFIHGFIELSPHEDMDENTWWTNRTTNNFKKVSQCIINGYNRYPEKDGFNNNSTVFEENVADFSGVNLAYTAYRKWKQTKKLGEMLPGVKYTADQLFWIMASTYLCYEPKLLEKDESRREEPIHAAPSYRVIGRLQNSPYFASAFNCPVGSPMNPQNKCRILA
ncbi:neprilysin-2-like [Anoplophora glabripennis]|uniref:neprilysin-2-like n=1 Tax=Anoplophora glabripennis TaxID=217634 RepID=UPI0008755C7F|nr:neprilysin-2-like [Anoplophora glabripennis]